MITAFSPEKKREELVKFDDIISQPDFWNNKESAKEVLKQMNMIKPQMVEWNKLEELRDESSNDISNIYL